MHPKRRDPGGVGREMIPTEPRLHAGEDLLGGYALDVFLQVLEADPAAPRQRREQQAIRAADDTGLVAGNGPGIAMSATRKCPR